MRSDVRTIEKQPHHGRIQYLRKNWQLYIVFMLPAVVLTVVFKYVPITGILMAFEDYSPFRGIFGSEWVGFTHFQRFLSSPYFVAYLLNTVKLSVYGLFWGFPVPIVLAVLLNRIRKRTVKKNVQLILYAPNFISTIVLCGMVFLLLSPVGPVNKMLSTQIHFMAMPTAFRTIYISSGIWQGAGWASIMYTAALSNASPEQTEAALIDGASILQQIWHVDLPAIKPIIVIQFILQAGNIMSIGFEKALALQSTLNISASEIIPTYVYKLGLQMGDYSFSTAVGLFNSVINVVLLLLVNAVIMRLNEGQGL